MARGARQGPRAYGQALDSITGNGEPYPRAAADLHVGLSELDRELDDLAGARRTPGRRTESSVSGPASPRTGSGGSPPGALRAARGPPRRMPGTARPGRALTGPASTPTSDPSRRCAPDPAHAAGLAAAAAGRGSGASPPPTTPLPARVRPSDPGPAAGRPLPGGRGAATGALDRGCTPPRRSGRDGSLLEIPLPPRRSRAGCSGGRLTAHAGHRRPARRADRELQVLRLLAATTARRSPASSTSRQHPADPHQAHLHQARRQHAGDRRAHARDRGLI